PPSEVLDGIRRAARGESVMAPEIMGKLMGQMTNPTEALTPRELEVLALVGEGKSNRDIARQLVLTEATVKSHLSHVFRKLGANNRTSAVAVARQRGVIA
ncbi:MAG TPA: response regulator transcription factor, partial [Candidatus Corynebacterium intestinavium]|nr:response regulator transcription factor [Candidatus Corynebacterium intestinavium]